MNGSKIMGIIFIVAGGLGLMYGGFSYTKVTHETTVGPVELSLKQEERVNVPIWAGVGTIVFGSLLLLFGSKKS